MAGSLMDRFLFGHLDRLSPPSPHRRGRRRRVVWIALLVVGLCGGASMGLLGALVTELPPTSELREYKPSLTTRLLDRQGRVLAQLFEQQRELVPMDQVPRALVDAFLALEDNRFYEHFGIDFTGLARAVGTAAWRRQRIGATSTITQQLARNLFLTQERSLRRKLKEALLAVLIERRFRKREILELYLNQIYFGSGAYGIQAAARTYFGKAARDLGDGECAMLAGIPRSPNEFNPAASLEKALRRQAVALDRMVKTGRLDAAAAAKARAQEIRLSRGRAGQAPYFVEHVRRELDDRYGSNLVHRGGLTVHTTLDARLQEAAEKAFDEGLVAAEARLRATGHGAGGVMPPLQAAFLCIDPATGGILAMIGGRNFKESSFNRAVQAKRQPGSAFKPFVYAAAFEGGFTQSDVLLDGAMVFTDATGREWKPENFEGRFFGPTLVRDALAHSRNVCTVKLLHRVGPAAAADLARRCGVGSTLRSDLSLGLGTSEVTLLEMTSAFGVFAHGGVRSEPYAIAQVLDSDGNVREQHAAQPREVLPPGVAAVLVDAMKNVVRFGTGQIVRASGFTRPCAGKTGTTSNYTDAWFVGFTPHLVAGVWIGFDNRRTMGRLMTGGPAAAPIWTAFMREAGRILELPPSDFARPTKDVEVVEVDARSGLRATDECPARVPVVFLTGTAPTRLWSDAPTDGPDEPWTVDFSPGETPVAEGTVLPSSPEPIASADPDGVSGTAGAADGATSTPTPEFRF